jgi:hypothetical protein
MPQVPRPPLAGGYEQAHWLHAARRARVHARERAGAGPHYAHTSNRLLLPLFIVVIVWWWAATVPCLRGGRRGGSLGGGTGRERQLRCCCC